MKLLIHLPLLAFCLSLTGPPLQKADSFKVVEKVKTKKISQKKDSTDAEEPIYQFLLSIITNKF
ncbi:MAG: hypothetical protein JWN76_665 [Chitinophagaceae bacterium]|nr:hypothetical protein [Chitinophagaceae bacterium]